MIIADCLLVPLNRLVNLALRLDPQAQSALYQLAGHCLAVEFANFSITLYFLISSDAITILSRYDKTPNTKLRGELFSMLAQKDIYIEGDPHFAQKFQQLFKRIDIDWEEQLSKLVGDGLAQQIGSQTKKQFKFIKKIFDTIKLNLVEYLQEETNQLPPTLEVQAFISNVDILRNDVERLALKIQRIATIRRETLLDTPKTIFPSA